MSQFNFHNSITGGNVQLNQGETVNATQNTATDKTPREILFELARLLDESDAPSQPVEAVEQINESPQMLCASLADIAETCPTETPEGLSKVEQLGKVLYRYWSVAKKPLLAFVDSALKTQAQNNWVVTGTISAIKALQSE